MVVFFSATGNSEYCARYIAELTQDKAVSSSDYIKNGQQEQLVSEKPWVFVCPTYSWQIPKVFSEFIKKTDFKGNKNAYFVMTCGGSLGGAASSALALCKAKGLHFKGLKGIKMPENYITMFKAPGKEEAEKIIEKACTEIENAAQTINCGKAFEKNGYGMLSFIKTELSSRLFTAIAMKGDKFYATDACVGCGTCAEKCVLGNITMKDGRPRWGNNCTQCMACISYCPKEAIEYGEKTKGKIRYRCKEFDK